MKNLALSLALVGALCFGAATASADVNTPPNNSAPMMALVDNAQCVGGTLYNQFQRVIEGTGVDTDAEAKPFAEYDCAINTPFGKICSVRTLTYPATAQGSGFTVFDYFIYDGGTITPKAGGTAGAARSAYFAGPTPTVTQPVTVSLVANPANPYPGQEVALTFSSQGATECVGTGFDTDGPYKKGRTSGTSFVYPYQTTTFSVKCTKTNFQGIQEGSATASATVTIPSNYGYTGHANSQCSGGTKIKTDSFGPTTCASFCSAQGASCCSVDFSLPRSPGDQIQTLGNDPMNMPAGPYNDVTCTAYSGTTAVVSKSSTSNCSGSSCEHNIYKALTKEQSSQAPAANIQASCRVVPTQAGVGDTVVWESSVSGGSGSYSYSWSGTDGLSGSLPEISKSYSTVGQKTASLTITDTATGSGTGYGFVRIGAPYFTKVCSGGSNTKSIQNPECGAITSEGGASCTAEQAGTKCKVHAYEDGGCTTGPGVIQETGEPMPGPTIYSWVSNYQCVALGGGAAAVTVQCDNALTVGDSGHPGGPQCSDGVDNDGDGRVDAADAGCGTGDDYDPGDDTEEGGPAPLPQCSDGLDNNGDGKKDYPQDPGCSSADDNLEIIDPAELNLKTTPPLIKKGQSCTIQLSALRVQSCSLVGPGISQTFAAVGGTVNQSSVVTPTLTLTSTYKMSCLGLDGKTSTKSVDCKVAPTFEEF